MDRCLLENINRTIIDIISDVNVVYNEYVFMNVVYLKKEDM